MSILSRLRSKYSDVMFSPKDRTVTDPDGLVLSSHDEDGREILDDTPMAPPVGLSRTPPMWEVIQQMIRSERLAALAAEAGAETFEEADDFDIPDDPFNDPATPYENDFDPTVSELKAAHAASKKAAADPKIAESPPGAPPPDSISD